MTSARTSIGGIQTSSSSSSASTQSGSRTVSGRLNTSGVSSASITSRTPQPSSLSSSPRSSSSLSNNSSTTSSSSPSSTPTKNNSNSSVTTTSRAAAAKSTTLSSTTTTNTSTTTFPKKSPSKIDTGKSGTTSTLVKSTPNSTAGSTQIIKLPPSTSSLATTISSTSPLSRTNSSSSVNSTTSANSTVSRAKSEEKETLEKQLKDLQNRFEQEKQSMDKLIAEKEMEMKNLVNQQTDTTTTELKNQLLMLEQEKEILEHQVGEMRNNALELKNEIETLKEDLQAGDEQHKERLNKIIKELKDNNLELETLKMQKHDLETKLELAQAQILNQLSNEEGTETEKLESLFLEKITMLEEEKITLEQIIQNSEREKKEQQLMFEEEKTALKVQQHQLELKINEITNLIDAKKQEREQADNMLKQSQIDMESLLGEMKSEISRRDYEISVKETSISEMKKEIEILNRKLTEEFHKDMAYISLSEELESMKTKVINLEGECTKIRGELQIAEQDSAIQVQKYNEMKNCYDEKVEIESTLVSQFECKYRAKEEDLSALNVVLQNLRTSLDKAEEQLSVAHSLNTEEVNKLQSKYETSIMEKEELKSTLFKLERDFHTLQQEKLDIGFKLENERDSLYRIEKELKKTKENLFHSRQLLTDKDTSLEDLQATLNDVEDTLKLEMSLKDQLNFTLSTEQKSREMIEKSLKDSAILIATLERKLQDETHFRNLTYEQQLSSILEEKEVLLSQYQHKENQIAFEVQEKKKYIQLSNQNEELLSKAALEIERLSQLNTSLESQHLLNTSSQKIMKAENENLKKQMDQQKSKLENLISTENSARQSYIEKKTELESTLQNERIEKKQLNEKCDLIMKENVDIKKKILESMKTVETLEQTLSIERKEKEVLLLKGKAVHETKIILEDRISELELEKRNLILEVEQVTKTISSQTEKSLKEEFQKQRKVLDTKLTEIINMKEQLEILLTSEKEQRTTLEQSSKRDIKKLQQALLEEKDFIIELERRIQDETAKNGELNKKIEDLSLKNNMLKNDNIGGQPESKKEEDTVHLLSKQQQQNDEVKPYQKSNVGVGFLIGIVCVGIGMVVPSILKKIDVEI